MPDFDPDKFLAETAPAKGPAFDPDKFLAETAPASSFPAPQKTSIPEALMRGAAQGSTLGFADEASAGANAVRDYLSAKFGLRGDIGMGDAYDTNLKAIRNRDALTKSEHPVATGIGQVGGSLATAAVPGLAVGNLASAPARFGAAAAMGGVAGAGESEHNPFKSMDELEGFGGDVGKGAILGGVAHGVLGEALPAIGRKLGGVPEALENYAERKATKAALGNQARPWDKLERQGRVNEVGRDLLDSGTVKFGSSARGIAERADENRQGAWDTISGLSNDVDKAMPEGAVNGKAIADDLRKWASENRSPGNKNTINNMLDQAQEFEQMGNIPMSEAQRMRGLYVFDPSDPNKLSIGKDATNAVYRSLGNAMEGGVDRYAQASKGAVPDAFSSRLKTGSGPSSMESVADGTPAIGEATQAAVDPSQALERFRAAKSTYGNFADASKAAETLGNRQEKNQSIGLSEKLAAIAGASVSGHLPMAAKIAMGTAGAGLSKVVRERGNSAMAVTADSISSILQKTPQAFGPWAKPLIDAVQRGGNQSLAATHFILSQTDPAYQERVKQLTSGDSDAAP